MTKSESRVVEKFTSVNSDLLFQCCTGAHYYGYINLSIYHYFQRLFFMSNGAKKYMKELHTIQHIFSTSLYIGYSEFDYDRVKERQAAR